MGTTSVDDGFLRLVLGNKQLYIGKEKWFKMLQDDGTPMAPAVEGKKVRKKSKNVRYNDMDHPELYKLAVLIYLLYTSRAGGEDGRFIFVARHSDFMAVLEGGRSRQLKSALSVTT